MGLIYFSSRFQIFVPLLTSLMCVSNGQSVRGSYVSKEISVNVAITCAVYMGLIVFPYTH